MTAVFPGRDTCVIADILERNATRTPEKPFALFADGQWTYEETAQRAWRLGNALVREGVQPGECVGVWLPNGPNALEAWFGTNAAGGVYAPFHPEARGTYLEHVFRLAEPRVVIVHARLVDRLKGRDLPTLRLVVTVGGEPEVEVPWRTMSLEDLVEGAEAVRPVLREPTEPWHDIALLYTSGTTGPSKAVRCAYAQHRLYADNLVWPTVGADDRFLLALPLNHVAGTANTFAMLQRGGSVALIERFDPKTFWADVRRFGATTTQIIHAMVVFLQKQPPRADDRDNPLRIVFMGPLSHVREFSERFDVSVFTLFGMSELPPPLRSELNPTNERSCGRPIDPDRFEVRLVDEHDLPVPVGTPGELVVRHVLPWVINSGYRKMPEATANAWRNGWFHTGDQFVEDEEGNFYFLDRTKDAIRRRGENISSFEVEAEVLTHPAVSEVAAVAVRNPDLNEETRDEEVKIIVVLKEDRTLGAEELVRYLVPRMPRHMVPRFVEFADQLPKSPSFKVMKNVLREQGVTARTWDRQAAGITLTRERLA